MGGQTGPEPLYSTTDTRFVVTRQEDRVVVHKMVQSGSSRLVACVNSIVCKKLNISCLLCGNAVHKFNQNFKYILIKHSSRDLSIRSHIKNPALRRDATDRLFLVSFHFFPCVQGA